MATLILSLASSDSGYTVFSTTFPIVTLEVSALTEARRLGTKLTGLSFFSGFAGEFDPTALTLFDVDELRRKKKGHNALGTGIFGKECAFGFSEKKAATRKGAFQCFAWFPLSFFFLFSFSDAK